MNRVILTGLLLASAQSPLGSTLMAVALPQIAAGLDVEVVQAASLLVSSYLVLTILCQGPAGRLSDTVGHLRTLHWGMGLFALGSIAGFLGPTLGFIAAARCVTAVGGALVVPSTLAIIRITAAPDRRGSLFGTFGAVMALSAALGPLLGAEIVGALGWRYTFLAALPFLAVAAVLLKLHPVPESGGDAAEGLRRFVGSIDWTGLGLLGAALVLIVAAGKIEGPWRPVLLAGGAFAGAAFAWIQCRSPRPALDVALLGRPVVAAGTGIMALHNFAMYGLLFQLPAYFAHFHQSPPRSVGQGLFAMMIGMVIASPVGGRLVDRWGPRVAGLAGAAATLAGTVLMCRLAQYDTPADAMPGLLLIGTGLGLASSPAQSAVMAAVEPARAGMAAGLGSTMRYLGGIATIAVQAVVLSGGDEASVDDHVTLTVVYAIAAFAALVAAALLPRSRNTGV
ncbi:MFS transporter [Alsobacter sp. R-9]